MKSKKQISEEYHRVISTLETFLMSRNEKDYKTLLDHLNRLRRADSEEMKKEEVLEEMFIDKLNNDIENYS